MKKVGISGFGTVGRRVADAVEMQEDMRLKGVAKTTQSATASKAQHNFGLYGIEDGHVRDMKSSGLSVEGNLRDLCRVSDVIVDCSPSGIGVENKPTYQDMDVKVIYQGGEDVKIADISYNSYSLEDNEINTEEIESARVVSCNTTGLSRLVKAINSSYNVERVSATLIRRGGDPGEINRGPINDIVPTMDIPSHHSSDLNEMIPEVEVSTKAVESPTTSMHMHSIEIEVENNNINASNIKEILNSYNRISVIPSKYEEVRSPADLRELSRMENRTFGSIWENTVWGGSVSVSGSYISLFQGIHQRSIVVPENIDAIRYLMGEEISESIIETDSCLNIGSLFR
jgi:glyceraldehyde-3-phosphate dehydrogenase (NAD(P))